MPIAAEQYSFVLGIDTHAAAHSFELINATNDDIIDQAVFPSTPAGFDRACTWITHGVDEKPALVVIEGAGSFGAGLAGRVTNSALPVAEPAAMPAVQRRGVGKTDALDAVRIARPVLAVDINRLRTPRADGQRVALRVLTVAREEMVAERTRRSTPLPHCCAPLTSGLMF